MKCRVIRGLLGQPGLHRWGACGWRSCRTTTCSCTPRVGLGDLLEEAQELLVAVPRVAGVGDLAGGDLQRGEQGGGAVADVVVGLLLRQARAHRQDRRGPVQRLDLAISRRRRAPPPSPAGSGTARRRRGPWPPARGSVENLNVSTRHGCRPHLRQIRGHRRESRSPAARPAAGSTSASPPAARGGGSSVASTTATSSITARPTRLRAGPPSPAMPSAAYRLLPADHRRLATPRPAARSRSFRRPSAASNTIRARCANPARIDGDRVHDSSTSRSRGGHLHTPQSTACTMIPRGKVTYLARH